MPRLQLALLALAALVVPSAGAQALLAKPPAQPAKTFTDPTYHLSFDYPATLNFSQNDGELSTFRLDARTAPARSVLRGVAALAENPFPASTFSGAYFYFSVTPHASAGACAQQATNTTIVKNTPHVVPGKTTRINDIAFTHGHDEVKDICITQRDEVYTARHEGACYRFDLSINNFCGGEVSSVKSISPAELDQVRTRLESILSTIRFDRR